MAPPHRPIGNPCYSKSKIFLSPGHIRRKRSHVFEQICAVTALNVLHDHAEVLPGLKGAVHRHNERIVCERHDVTLGENLINLMEKKMVYTFI